jgi:uncharacterized protein (TIGR03067 family)
MTLRISVILVVAFLPSVLAQEKNTAEELKRLEGEWVLVGREFDGEKDSAEEVEKSRIKVVIKGDKLTATSRGDPDGATYTLKVFPDANPKASELSYTSGPMKGQKAYAIYKLDGDQLTVCRSPSKRPTEFSTKPNSDRAILIYKRQKK